MKFFNWLKPKAATSALPDVLPPKVPASKGVTLPFLGKEKNSKISNNATNITSLVLSDFSRTSATMNETIKKICLASSDLSYALECKLKATISEKFTVIAYNELGVVDEPATRLAQAFVMRLNYGSHDYTRFTKTSDIRSLAASCLMDSMRYGSMAMELVLGSTRLPAYFRALPSRLLSFADNTPDTYPIYKDPVVGDIPLNYPTIFYSVSSQDQESAYADSPIQSAIQAALWDADFADMLRRAAGKNLLARLKVTIDSEKYLKTLPFEVTSDSGKLKEHMDSTIAALESQLANLDPSDTLVIFDVLAAETIADSNNSSDRSIEVLQGLINGKLSAGAKILPSVIGRGESSNAASSEALLFVKAIGSVQHEFNLFFSHGLTLALRLMGHDVNVVFKFSDVNLRPELELASFRSIVQATELELLSLGMSSDLETIIKLTGTLPPSNYKPLSGTGFYKKAADTKSSNDYSNTSVDTTSGKTDSTQSQKDQEK